MTPILLTGGTGTLGRIVHRKLDDLAVPVRVLSRKARPGMVQGDLTTGEGIAAAVEGVSTIIHCSTSPRGEVAMAKTLLGFVKQAHLVYISIVGVDRVPMPYYKSKFEVERLIEGSDLPWTTLRATQFHDLMFSVFHVQRWLPCLFASAIPFQPIDAETVADRLVELALGEPAGRVPDIGGPEVRTAVSLGAAYLKGVGSRRRVVSVRLPGKIFAAARAGHLVVPDNAAGTVTFEEYLRRRP